MTYNRTVWMLWLQGEEDAPELVKACIASWRRHNPDWDIRVLTESDLAELWATDEDRQIAQKMSRQALSDLVRLTLLTKEGGVWADATCLCMMPLENWLPAFMARGFFAFDRPGNDRPVASWFLAAKQDSYITHAWLDAVRKVWSLETVKGADGIEKAARLIKLLPKEGPLWRQEAFWRDNDMLPYFWVHYLFDLLLHRDQKFRRIWANVPKFSANVPHMCQQQSMLDEEKWPEPRFAGFLDANPAPFFKLNWRAMDPAKSANLRALLDRYS